MIKIVKLIFFITACVFLTSSLDYQDYIHEVEQETAEVWLPPTDDIIHLRERIDNIISSYDSFEYDYGLRIISLEVPQVFYEYQIDKPFMPASNMKIITTAAAFDLLGRDFAWVTEFYRDEQDNIYLKASGDPTINRHSDINHFFKSITDSLKIRGIRVIQGDLIIEPSGFNDSGIGYGWKEENSHFTYSAKPSALPFFENTIQIKISPSNIERRPYISLYPAHVGFEIVNDMTTVGNNRGGLWFEMDPYSNRITFHGSIWLRSKPQYRTLAVQKPELYALEVIREKFRENQITIEGNIYYNTLPEQENNIETLEKLFQIETPKFIEVVNEINKRSNNFMANQLFMTIGERFESSNQAEDVIKNWLRANNISPDSLKMYDGSGLSIYNQSTANILSSTLRFMYNSDWSEDFMNSMAVSGRDGTLRNSFQNDKLRHKVFGKTGFIIGARALSGFIRTQDDEMLAFSIIINKEGSRIRNFNQIIERVLIELATFEREKLEFTENYFLLDEIEIIDNDSLRIDTQILH